MEWLFFYQIIFRPMKANGKKVLFRICSILSNFETMLGGSSWSCTSGHWEDRRLGNAIVHRHIINRNIYFSFSNNINMLFFFSFKEGESCYILHDSSRRSSVLLNLLYLLISIPDVHQMFTYMDSIFRPYANDVSSYI